MSSDEELNEIRRRKMLEMQQQAAQQQALQEQQQALQERLEQQRQAILRKILSPEARQRLTNIKMVRPEFAQSIENQLIQLAQAGQLSRLGIPLPMSDKDFKRILLQLSERQGKRDFKIKKV